MRCKRLTVSILDKSVTSAKLVFHQTLLAYEKDKDKRKHNFDCRKRLGDLFDSLSQRTTNNETSVRPPARLPEEKS